LCDPIAIVTEKAVGMAIGIPPIRSTRRLLTKRISFAVNLKP
jgi:hypothetical protein